MDLAKIDLNAETADEDRERIKALIARTIEPNPAVFNKMRADIQVAIAPLAKIDEDLRASAAALLRSLTTPPAILFYSESRGRDDRP